MLKLLTEQQLTEQKQIEGVGVEVEVGAEAGAVVEAEVSCIYPQQ